MIEEIEKEEFKEKNNICEEGSKEDKSVILIEMNPHVNLNNSEEVNETINIPLMKDTIHLVVNDSINNYELF